MENILKKYWKGKEIIKYNYSSLKKLGISEQDANLLSKCGLPKGAAPYLNFEVDKAQEKEEIYYNIGFTGSGDFICLEKAGGRVVYLDHEEEDEKAVLINSSLTALLESIICYRKFVDKVNENDMWSYINSNYSIRQMRELEEELRKMNAAALKGILSLQENWQADIQMLWKEPVFWSGMNRRQRKKLFPQKRKLDMQYLMCISCFCMLQMGHM